MIKVKICTRFHEDTEDGKTQRAELVYVQNQCKVKMWHPYLKLLWIKEGDIRALNQAWDSSKPGALCDLPRPPAGSAPMILITLWKLEKGTHSARQSVHKLHNCTQSGWTLIPTKSFRADFLRDMMNNSCFERWIRLSQKEERWENKQRR